MQNPFLKIVNDLREVFSTKSSAKTKLSKMTYWLNLDFVTSYNQILVWLLIFPIMMFIVIFITPIILKTLNSLNKKNWLYTFLCVTLLPLLIIPLINESYVKAILLFAPILNYFLFCFVLRFEANDWLEEIRAKEKLEKAKIEKEEKKDSFDWIIRR